MTELERLKEENKRLKEIANWTQAAVTALFVGDIKQGSLLHTKLRDVMIQFRETPVEPKPNKLKEFIQEIFTNNLACQSDCEDILTYREIFDIAERQNTAEPDLSSTYFSANFSFEFAEWLELWIKYLNRCPEGCTCDDCVRAAERNLKAKAWYEK